MFQPAISVIAQDDFNRALSTVNNETPLKHLPKVVLKTFLTKDSFYRPTHSEFINSYTDLNGKIVRVYALDFSKTILVLSETSQGEYQHSLYTTTDREGFYLNEVFELMSILGY